MEHLQVTELAQLLESLQPPLLIDVREEWEVNTAAIDGARHIPMNQIPERLDELRADAQGRALVVMCHSGGRSRHVVAFLERQGFERVCNLDGGIDAWSVQVDPGVPRY